MNDKPVIIESYQDIVQLFGNERAAEMLSDSVSGWVCGPGDIKDAILKKEQIYLEYLPSYDELKWVAQIVGDLLADTSLEWAKGFIPEEKFESHNLITHEELSHAVSCKLSDIVSDSYEENCYEACRDLGNELIGIIEDVFHGDIEVDDTALVNDLREQFGLFYYIDVADQLDFESTLILYENNSSCEGEIIDAALEWQFDYLPLVCHKGGPGEEDVWEYEPSEDYKPFERPSDIPETIFDKLCASQGTSLEKVLSNPETKFERTFREDIFNSYQGGESTGLAIMSTMPFDAFIDATLAMMGRDDCESIGTFTVKAGHHEPYLGIYDPVDGRGGTMGVELDTDFKIEPSDIVFAIAEPESGKWKSGTAVLSTPQHCFGLYKAFDGCLEYTEAVKSGTKEQLLVEESLDEMMEQKVEVAGDSEICDELSVSNGER